MFSTTASSLLQPASSIATAIANAAIDDMSQERTGLVGLRELATIPYLRREPDSHSPEESMVAS